jgi:hypothetical protein
LGLSFYYLHSLFEIKVHFCSWWMPFHDKMFIRCWRGQPSNKTVICLP